MTDLISAFDAAGISLFLVGIVFAASCIQAITGIGFGVIAGPMLLVSMGSGTAIQLSIILSFLIAVLLAPATLPRVSWTLLRPLLAGVVLGTPIGALAFAFLSIDMLKIIAALVVAAMTVIATGFLSRHPVFETDSRSRRIGSGILSGIFNAALAMPGPPIAAYATAIRRDKHTIRATTLVTFLFAYPIALAFQAGFSGFGEGLGWAALLLALPTVAGTIIGLFVAAIISERYFRWLTIAFLLASVVALVGF